MDKLTAAERYVESMHNGAVYRTTFTEFRAAICHVVLGDYDRALNAFDEAVLEMLTDKMWMKSGEPNCIVEAFALSKRSVAPERVQDVIRDFGTEQNSTSPLFHYSMVLAGMLWPGYSDVRYHIRAILDRRHSKYMGSVVQFALSVTDNGDIVGSADHLIRSSRVHNHQRYGTEPRGYLCLPLMSILAVVESSVVPRWPTGDMISLEYLDYRRIH